MDYAELSRWRTHLGRLSALCGLLLFTALLDGIVAQFRQPANLLEVLPGSTREVNGGLPEDLANVQEMRFISDSPQLQITFEELHRGYFLGGSMWRGRLTVSPGTQPGKYALAVGSQATLTSKPYMIYRVIVYPDQETRRQSSRSLVERYLGWSPWALALFFAAFLGLGFGGVYLLSQKMDKVLLEAGKAEIFRVARGEGWCNVAFGLGSRHGIQTGMQLAIINDQGQAIGEAEVLETTETDAVARVISGHDIRLGWLVSRN